MKIVFFLHRYWPSVGGVEKYIQELSRALLAKGHRVTVVAGATTEGLAERAIHDGVEIYRFPALRIPLRCRLWLWRHLNLFAEADVVHVSNMHVLEYFWRMLGPMVSRHKVFLTRHGMNYVYPVPSSFKFRAQRSLQLAAGVIHDGAFIERWLGVAPNACPDQGLYPEAADLPFVPEPEPTRAVYIGRLEPDSGIAIYLDGVRRLVRMDQRPFQLEVYGDGSLRPKWEEVVRRESLPVRFHGRQPDAQQFIPQSCFAFLDGRMAMQEAMARRRLVFAAYVDSLKQDYVAGESFSPYLVPVSNGAELAERVAYFLDHPEERAAWVQRAYQHARTLSWHRTAQAYLDLWNEKLARPNRQASWIDGIKRSLSLSREARMRSC